MASQDRRDYELDDANDSDDDFPSVFEVEANRLNLEAENKQSAHQEPIYETGGMEEWMTRQKPPLVGMTYSQAHNSGFETEIVQWIRATLRWLEVSEFQSEVTYVADYPIYKSTRWLVAYNREDTTLCYLGKNIKKKHIKVRMYFTRYSHRHGTRTIFWDIKEAQSANHAEFPFAFGYNDDNNLCSLNVMYGVTRQKFVNCDHNTITFGLHNVNMFYERFPLTEFECVHIVRELCAAANFPREIARLIATYLCAFEKSLPCIS